MLCSQLHYQKVLNLNRFLSNSLKTCQGFRFPDEPREHRNVDLALGRPSQYMRGERQAYSKNLHLVGPLLHESGCDETEPESPEPRETEIEPRTPGPRA